MAVYNKVFFHGTGRDSSGYGSSDYVSELDALGIPVVVKVINNGGFAEYVANLARGSGVPHTIVYRDVNPGGVIHDLPNFNLPPGDSAAEHWGRVLSTLPPEVAANKDLIWIEPTNEIDTHTKAQWLGEFCTHLARIANQDGYKVMLSGFNAGQPEPEHWELYFANFLELCSRFPDSVAISVHEGKTTTDGRAIDQPISDFPDLIGRFLNIHTACDSLGLTSYPSILISEWAWSYNDLPTRVVVERDIKDLSAMLAQYPNVLGACLWNLDAGWASATSKLPEYIKFVTDFTKNTTYPDVNPDKPALTFNEFAWNRSIHVQKELGLSLNAHTALQKEIFANEAMGYNIVTNEFNFDYGGESFIGQAAEHIGGLSPRKLFLVNTKDFSNVWFITDPKAVVVDPPPAPPLLQPEISDGFDAPIGTPSERREANATWPGAWFDVNPFGNRYTNPSTGHISYHTGSDLNLNTPHWDADRGKPVYSCANGVVTAAGQFPVWGNIIVIKHKLDDGSFVYSRYGHIHQMQVVSGDFVKRGDPIAVVGQDALGGAFHLHFDISTTNVLERTPNHWPGQNQDALFAHYIDPRMYIEANRPMPMPMPDITIVPEVGIHNEDGAEWMLANNVVGWALHTVALGANSTTLDMTRFENVGIKVLVRLNWGYSPVGTIPDPRNVSDVKAFVTACVNTIKSSRGVFGWIIGNEGNNPWEFPNKYAFTPEEYAEIYNQIWWSVTAGDLIAPMAVDPYYGPGSNNRDYWVRMLTAIEGADFLTIHPKTQDSVPGNVDSLVKFSHEPLLWQYLHFNSYVPLLGAVPFKYKDLPVYATECNPQRKLDGTTLGWDEATGAEWVLRAWENVFMWNSDTNKQQIHALIYYRYSADNWAFNNMPAVLNQIKSLSEFRR